MSTEPTDPWAPGVRAADVPVGGFEATDTPLYPNKADIERHLYALFPPTFVQPYPDAWIEIAFCRPDESLNKAHAFSAFDLEGAAKFAADMNARGFNVYVGAALRHGEQRGRANGANVLTASHSWAEFDRQGDEARIEVILREKDLLPAMTVVTGTRPNLRAHLYFKLLTDKVTPDLLNAANTAMRTTLGSDDVQNPDRIMRLAGTVNYPTPKKIERGYVPELVTLHVAANPRAYRVDTLINLTSGTANPYLEHSKSVASGGRSDDELRALLEACRKTDNWHNPMRAAVATMIGRGWSDSAIGFACAPFCEGGYEDRDLRPLIDGGRKKWNKPDEESVAPDTGVESDVERLNKVHAVLPIGGKTRVVTFGEMQEFPGRETIVMTQTICDFTTLQNKYRHNYQDEKGEPKSKPMGSYWVGSPERRQYDGGMAFMPQHDGDIGDKLNLWRGFGVKASKPDGKSGAEGCQKFLDFMRNIICSGNEAHFDYLLKREATICQRRIRTEVALGLQTKQEGCGKGFYEATMGHLLGTHAMQLGNPEHIIGKFNPHLETLLRVTADEALFVGDHKHRNALFGLITEPTLTIEPKGCGVYTAASYLNLSITSNSDHFLPVSDTARRFFIPTVSVARQQDHEYFASLKAELDNGGYEALLYHLLCEVDLTDFNVRKVPQTEGLRQQRDRGLPPLDAWWCELLETGTLRGCDPKEPHRAVSNGYSRMEKIETESHFGDSNTQIRHVYQPGLYDQARQIEPRLRNFTNDRLLGIHLSEMGCDNGQKVLRRRGWTFPPLQKCRAEWEKRYSGYEWRNPQITEWQPEESDETEAMGEAPKSRELAESDEMEEKTLPSPKF